MTIPKKVVWIGSSLNDLRDFPEDVKDEIGHALLTAQTGGKSHNAKPLKGFRGASVLAVRDDFDGDTYRAVYTIEFEEAVFVLHCFQKKSTHGISTSVQDIELIKRRLMVAEAEHKEWLKQSQLNKKPKGK